MLEHRSPGGGPSPFVTHDLGAIEEALLDAGVSGGELSDALGLFERTLLSPVLTCALRLRRAGHEALFNGALGPALFFYGQSVAVDESSLALLGLPDELPRAIAELIELGPTPCDPSWPDIPMPYELLDACAGVGTKDDLLDLIESEFVGILPPLALAGLLDGKALRWTLSFGTGTEEGGPRIDAIDAGERGLWLIEEGPEPGAVWVRPMTSTAAWLMIVGQVNAALLAVTS